jgi:hypothetical protein
MNGQWLGRYSGTNSGTFVLDVDDLGSHFQGFAYLYDDNPDLPATMAFVRTPSKEHHLELEALVKPFVRPLADPREWEDVSSSFAAGTNVPTKAQITIDWSETELSASAKTDIGTSVHARVPHSAAREPSDYAPLSNVNTWNQFKEHVVTLDVERYIFRGQRKQWRIRTRYHRTGRADLVRFQSHDVALLHRTLMSRTKHIFDLNIPDQLGAFLSLVQHHGYPTPLLDWSYSPFVAAFFAYWHILNVDAGGAGEDDRVRIFMFDRQRWLDDFPHLPFLRPFGLNLSVLDFIALENDRMVPQQSVSTVTNVDDVETYIRFAEGVRKKQYMTVIDLPVSERPLVMRQLRLMGITAGSLFPGLDGACEELRERNF